MGMLTYIGGKRALADLKNVKLKGLSIWIFWRAIYLTKLVSLKNKILVLFDWFKTSLFGRDISRF
jgi:NADH:ubiquinone reductase (non-electrogenic)